MNRRPFRAKTHELERSQRRIERRSESKKLVVLKNRLKRVTAQPFPTHPNGRVEAA